MFGPEDSLPHPPPCGRTADGALRRPTWSHRRLVTNGSCSSIKTPMRSPSTRVPGRALRARLDTSRRRVDTTHSRIAVASPCLSSVAPFRWVLGARFSSPAGWALGGLVGVGQADETMRTVPADPRKIGSQRIRIFPDPQRYPALQAASGPRAMHLGGRAHVADLAGGAGPVREQLHASGRRDAHPAQRPNVRIEVERSGRLPDQYHQLYMPSTDRWARLARAVQGELRCKAVRLCGAAGQRLPYRQGESCRSDRRETGARFRRRPRPGSHSTTARERRGGAGDDAPGQPQ